MESPFRFVYSPLMAVKYPTVKSTIFRPIFLDVCDDTSDSETTPNVIGGDGDALDVVSSPAAVAATTTTKTVSVVASRTANRGWPRRSMCGSGAVQRGVGPARRPSRLTCNTNALSSLECSSHCALAAQGRHAPAIYSSAPPAATINRLAPAPFLTASTTARGNARSSCVASSNQQVRGSFSVVSDKTVRENRYEGRCSKSNYILRRR